MKKLVDFLKESLAFWVVILVLAMTGSLAFFAGQNEDGTRTFNGNSPKYSESIEKAYCEVKASTDSAVASTLGFEAPQDSGSGCEPKDRELAQMGSGVYFRADLSSPASFVNSMNGRGFNEGYGYQCVAGFKQFMFSLSGRVVATRTGGASGYAGQVGEIQALGFTWHAGQSGMRDGDWAIFGGGKYGHVAMYYQGKFFGQNQGSGNIYVGNAFNLMDLGSYKNSIIGYFRPNIWANLGASTNSSSSSSTVPSGSVSSSAQKSTSSSVIVQKGDTLGGIAIKNGWWQSGALFGNDGYAQILADKNGISNRGLIYPGQVIKK